MNAHSGVDDKFCGEVMVGKTAKGSSFADKMKQVFSMQNMFPRKNNESNENKKEKKDDTKDLERGDQIDGLKIFETFVLY
ncbi:hypothetical protein TIFTF001_003175 [Ficus carica]|uniref:Uncharacterized protein n=1 Tax=Ficus carica TaxID=3494 RepID=A0AA87Z7X3_FICCA|nr:hypothetical protein TIFTF001_003175 [Ficus carica]